MTVKSQKGAKAKADRLFSKIVRARGSCERCGQKDYRKLQCAHIKSRRYSNTRCVFENAFCLCASCHFFYTHNPDEFGKFIDEHRTEKQQAHIRELARSTNKVDWEQVASALQAHWERISGNGG